MLEGGMAALLRDLGVSQARASMPVENASELMRLADEPLLVAALLQKAGKSRTPHQISPPVLPPYESLALRSGAGPASPLPYLQPEPRSESSLFPEHFVPSGADLDWALHVSRPDSVRAVAVPLLVVAFLCSLTVALGVIFAWQ